MTNNKLKKTHHCNLCERIISNETGACEFCGWVQQTDIDRPDEIHWSYNFVSFNKAKQLLNEGKALKPDFNEFLECMKIYGELEFCYNDKQYGVLTNHNGGVHFYKWNEMDEGYQEYLSLKEFEANANIQGALLKDIWSHVNKMGVST